MSRRHKAWATYSKFIGIPCVVGDTDAFKSLAPAWRALYLDLRRQHTGRNNGDISAADAILGKLGWAHSSIHRGLKALQRHGLIEKTRQGGIGSMSRTCSLYAFTDEPTVDNKAKGIAGKQGSWAYKTFVPEPKFKKRRRGKNASKVSLVDLKGTNGRRMKVPTVDTKGLKGTTGGPSIFSKKVS